MREDTINIAADGEMNCVLKGDRTDILLSCYSCQGQLI